MNQIKSFVEQNKWVVGIIVLVLAVFVALALMNKTSEAPPELAEGCRPGDEFSQTSGKPCQDEESQPCQEGELYDRNTGEPCVGVKDKTATPATGVSSYEAVLQTYVGKSFLFDASCDSTPSKLETVIGSKVLVANNSPKTLELSIQNRKENLLPYHYMTSLITTVGEFAVTCDGKAEATVSVK